MDSSFSARKQQPAPREMADHICRVLETAGVGKEVSLLPVHHLTQMTLLATEIISVSGGFNESSGRLEFINAITGLRRYALRFQSHVLEPSKVQPPLFDELDKAASRQRELLNSAFPRAGCVPKKRKPR